MTIHIGGTNILPDSSIKRQHLEAQAADRSKLSTDVLSSLDGRPVVLVAASNAPDTIKAKAVSVCSGTNDQIIINSTLASYGTVILSAGLFKLGGPILLGSNANLIGQGISTEVRRDSILVGGYASAVELKGSAAAHITNVAISAIKFAGPSASATMIASNGVTVTYADFVTIADCEFYGFGSLGDDGIIAATYTTNLTITNCNGHDSLNGPIFGKAGGVTAPNCTDIIVHGNKFHHMWADGSHGQNCDRISWANNACYLNGESGIDMLGCYHCTVVGNLLSFNAHEGVEVGQTVSSGREDRGHTIVGNTCIGNHTNIALAGGGGILLSGKTSSCVVTGNTCLNNNHYGITAGCTSASLLVADNLITANVVENNTQTGIHIFGNATNNVVTNNSVRNHVERGIDMTLSSTFTPTGTVIKDNVILGAPTTVYRSGGLDATTIVQNNVGFKTEGSGVASVANGNTIAHGLAVTPVNIQLTATVMGHIATVTAASSTTITVALCDAAGVAVTVAENVRWSAAYT